MSSTKRKDVAPGQGPGPGPGPSFPLPSTAGPSKRLRTAVSGPGYSRTTIDGADDDEEDEEDFDPDFVGERRKGPGKGRGGGVIVDGYGSQETDSDSDGEDADADAEEEGDRKDERDTGEGPPGGGQPALAGGDDDDDDMFNPDPSEKLAADSNAQREAQKAKMAKEKKGPTAVEDLVEGQDFASGSKGPQGALSDESDDGQDRDPDLELESDSDSGDEGDEEMVDAAADGERTPPLSPGGTTVLNVGNKLRKKNKKNKKSHVFTSDPGTGKGKFRGQGNGHGSGNQDNSRFDESDFGVTGFNMKSEMASGSFDSEGNYVTAKRDPNEEHDKWLEGVYSKKRIRQAREAAKKREEEERKRERKGAESMKTLNSREKIMQQILRHLKRGESPMEGMQRYGVEAKKAEAKAGKKKPLSNQAKRKLQQQSEAGGSSATQNPQEEVAIDADASPPAKSPAKEAIESLTSLTTLLMERYDVYGALSMEWEQLARFVSRAGLEVLDCEAEQPGQQNGHDESGSNGTQSHDPPKRFIYRWAESSAASPETFGPFDLQGLQEWRKAGYFGAEPGGTERILLKPVGGGTVRTGEEAGQDKGWGTWNQVVGEVGQ